MKSNLKRQSSEGRMPWTIALAALLLCAASHGRTLNGVVLDAYTRLPVPYAEVSAYNLDVHVLTDSVGRFEITAEPGLKTVALEASRVGYETRRYRKVSINRPATLYIQPEAIRLKGVSVTAFRTPVLTGRSGPVSVIEGRALESRGRTDISPVLAQSPSVTLQDYGNVSTVAMRGGTSEQTTVMLDGVRLNSARDNLADLATLPLNLAGRVEVARGGSSALYGANSVAGIANIITPEPEKTGISMMAGVGSCDRGYGQFTHTYSHGPFGYVLAGNLTRAPNDFSYGDSLDSLRERVNADYANTGLLAKATLHQGRHRASLLGEYNVSRRGSPGPLTWPSPSARQSDYRSLVHFNYSLQETDRGRLETKLFHHQLWHSYSNPDPFAPMNDTHVTTTSGGMLNQNWYFARGLAALGGIEASRELCVSTAVGNPQRWTTAAWLEARLEWLGFELVPAVRLDRLAETRLMEDSSLFRANHRVVSPKLSLTWSGLNAATLYAGAGRSFRAPTFNELFWPADPWASGNPHLKPEWATSVDFGITGARPSFASWRLSAFRSQTTDLIEWLPDSVGFYMPVNVDTATVTGAEADAGLGFHLFGMDGSAAWTNARSRDKALTYRPRLSGRVTGWLGPDWLRLSLTANHVGKRYVDGENTDSLPGYWLADAGLSCGPLGTGPKASIRTGVRNALNRQYESVKGFPLPGRNWYAELELRI